MQLSGTRKSKASSPERGRFRAELSIIGLRGVWMQRGEESLPRVLRVACDPNRVGAFFPTAVNQPAMYLSGLTVSPGEMVVARTDGGVDHYRSAAACNWGVVALTVEDFAAASSAIAGRELVPPTVRRRITPGSPAFSRLLRLHGAVDHLAKAAPEILANPEVTRGFEQTLTQAMVTCVAEGGPSPPSTADRLHRAVVLGLEDTFQANLHRPLYLAELCAAAGVSERTLRVCCHEHLGMSPIRYLWLRRMHLAHRALLLADSRAATVTTIAANHGFWEFGRFAVAYRSLFGESPSKSLHRPPADPQACPIADFPVPLPESA